MDEDRERPAESDPGETVDVDAVLVQLRELEAAIETPEQHRELQDARRMLERMPGGSRISKYTSRDVGEALVGSVIFALPLLVEDGVFEIADHFLAWVVAGVPLFLVGHVLFVVGMTFGIIYGVDFREVQITNPILGVVPRRYVGILSVSFVATAALMMLWGRLLVDEPSALGALARVTVIWAAAALGASLGDILPGESKGTDLTIENLDEVVDIGD